MSDTTQTKILCILDGFGIAIDNVNNCVSNAKMPNFRKILNNYTFGSLNADGISVGQEDGLVGNSEVGHINIGALKLVPQLSYQITSQSERAFALDHKKAPNQFFDPSEFIKSKSNLAVHIVGLFSTGSIHSDMRHLKASIISAGQSGASSIVLHLFSDGRDSDKKSLLATWDLFYNSYKNELGKYNDLIKFGSLGGRFYSMDRDNNMNRVAIGFLGALDSGEQEVKGFAKDELNYADYVSQPLKDSQNGLSNIYQVISTITQDSYSRDIFDEIIEPQFFCKIKKGDIVWLFNFRSDRMKQLTKTLCKANDKLNLELSIISMNSYDIGLEQSIRDLTTGGYAPIFGSDIVPNTLSSVLSANGYKQLHIAETEKYAHVTYFFNGGDSKESAGEDWVLIPSNKVDSHAQMPNMKAKEITDYIIDSGFGKCEYIIVNFANPDMVGHTGDIKAGIESMEFLDLQIGRLLDIAERDNHKMMIIADHGNIEFVGEYVKDNQNLTDTEHNANPVPLILVGKEFTSSEFDLSSLITKIQTTNDVYQLEMDSELVIKCLGSRISKDFAEQWFDQNDYHNLQSTSLPLWYSSAILLAM